MEKIWANRILANTKKLSEAPASRQAGIIEELKRRLADGVITQAQYDSAMGIEPEGDSADM